MALPSSMRTDTVRVWVQNSVTRLYLVHKAPVLQGLVEVVGR